MRYWLDLSWATNCQTFVSTYFPLFSFFFFFTKCILAFHISAQEVLNRSSLTCGADVITAEAKVGQNKLIERGRTVRLGDIWPHVRAASKSQGLNYTGNYMEIYGKIKRRPKKSRKSQYAFVNVEIIIQGELQRWHFLIRIYIFFYFKSPHSHFTLMHPQIQENSL